METSNHIQTQTVEESKSRERKELQHLVAEKEEICRKLKLVKMYRSKNDLDAMQGLITKWRDACQTAILRLYERHPEPKPSLAEFISTCRLDKDLIGFDVDDETFT